MDTITIDSGTYTIHKTLHNGQERTTIEVPRDRLLKALDMEDYKEKYLRALEKARKIYDNPNATESGKMMLCDMFPELNKITTLESIINLIKQSTEILDKSNQEHMLGYLENIKSGPKDEIIKYLTERMKESNFGGDIAIYNKWISYLKNL